MPKDTSLTREERVEALLAMAAQYQKEIRDHYTRNALAHIVSAIRELNGPDGHTVLVLPDTTAEEIKP